MTRRLLLQLARLTDSRRGMVLCVLGVWLVLFLGHFTPCIDMNPDSARYLALGRSIAEGRGYTLQGRFCRAYPPLFPLMLSTVHSADRFGYRPEKLLTGLGMLGGLLATYWLLSQRHEGRLPAVLTLLVAVSATLWRYCVTVRSDLPFFFFAAVFLAAATRFWRAERLSWSLGVLAAAALGLAVLTRAAGLVFVLACCAWLIRPSLWKKDARRCLVFAVVLLLIACPPAAGWMRLVSAHKDTGTYSYSDFVQKGLLSGVSPFSSEGFRRLLSTETRSVPIQLASAGESILRVGGKDAGALWALVLIPVVLLGLARRMRHPELLDYVFCGYGLQVLLWPWPQGARLWAPVLPLMLSYLADGIAGFGRIAEDFPRLARRRVIERLDRALGRARRSAAVWGAALLLVVGILSGVATVAGGWRECRRAIRGVYLTGGPLEAARFLTAPHERSVVLAFSRFLEVEPALAAHGNKVIGIPLSAGDDPRAILRALQSRGATHVAVQTKAREHRAADQMIAALREELLVAGPAAYRLVADTERIQIFALPAPEGE